LKGNGTVLPLELAVVGKMTIDYFDQTIIDYRDHSQSPVLVPQRELGLRPEDDTPVLEFEPETLLVDGFQEPTAHFLVNLEATAHDPVAFVFMNDLRHPSSPLSRVSRSEVSVATQ
jgi:hypothetical protein